MYAHPLTGGLYTIVGFWYLGFDRSVIRRSRAFSRLRSASGSGGRGGGALPVIEATRAEARRPAAPPAGGFFRAAFASRARAIRASTRAPPQIIAPRDVPSIAPPSAGGGGVLAASDDMPSRDAASFDFFRSPPSSELRLRSLVRPSVPPERSSAPASPPKSSSSSSSRPSAPSAASCTDAAVGGAPSARAGCAESASTASSTARATSSSASSVSAGSLAGLGGAIERATSDGGRTFTIGEPPSSPSSNTSPSRGGAGAGVDSWTLSGGGVISSNVARKRPRSPSGPSSTCWNEVASTCSSGCCVATACDTIRRSSFAAVVLRDSGGVIPAGATCPAPGFGERIALWTRAAVAFVTGSAAAASSALGSQHQRRSWWIQTRRAAATSTQNSRAQPHHSDQSGSTIPA